MDKFTSHMSLRYCIIYIILVNICFFSSSIYAQRTIKTINEGWEFRKKGDSEWKAINLPHTYNLDAYSYNKYFQGEVEYRKILHISDLDLDNKCYYLKIDAANKSANVKVNGQIAGSHAGGYSAFIIDITDYIKTINNIEIIVDNSRKDITPISADFTFWGGIYRDVWLITTPKQHFNMSNHGSSGVFVDTPVINKDKGIIRVRSEISNDANIKKEIKIQNVIYDTEGKIIQTKGQDISLRPKETVNVEFMSNTISNPHLWSPESPSLYIVVTTILNVETGEILDEVFNNVGFRWFSFDADKGFFLNGKQYKLRGVNRHQDQYPVGVAIDDEVNRHDIELIKDIGCNFIRIAHYPQDDALLDACDKLGLLVWEEIPIVNIVPDTPNYNENCEINLVEMIRQHYNHTSVIAWGYMNEILLTAPTPDKKDWPLVKKRTVKLAQRLEKRLKEVDPSRVSVMAFHGSDLYNTAGLAISDVSGWNLYQGWYFGELTDFEKWLEDQHNRYPSRPIIVSEWGAGSDRRLHSVNSKPFDFSIEYQQKYIEHYLPYIEKNDYIAGCAYWNFIDFNVAARQESMPRFNNKGLFYNNRTPKDVAYYFKAMWRQDITVLHIATRDWQLRTGLPNEKQAIKIYTNLDEVELFLNGKSCGKQIPINFNTIFNIKLPNGISSLVAKGYKNGNYIEDAITITYNHIQNSSDKYELAINVGSNCFFTSNLSQFTWLPDKPYEAGSWGYIGGKAYSTTSEINNTIDGPIYQTWMEGISEYKIDAPPGMYEVELLFADASHPVKQQANLLGKEDTKTDPRKKSFDIIICGEKIEKNYSPAEDNRYLYANKKRYIINNNNGCINVSFIPIQGKAILSGIKVRRM